MKLPTNVESFTKIAQIFFFSFWGPTVLHLTPAPMGMKFGVEESTFGRQISPHRCNVSSPGVKPQNRPCVV